MNDYIVVTVANKRPTENYYTFDEFFKSLNGEDIYVLGTHEGEYGGLGSKMRLLYNFIKSNQVQSKHIIFSDCFDVVFAKPIKELYETFLTFKSPFVISAEKNCFPDTYKEEYDKLDKGVSHPYKYLNSGMIVAETEALLTVLEYLDAANVPNDYWDGVQMINPNDQEYYQRAFLVQPVKMTMDYNQRLCNTLHSVEMDEFEFREEGIYNKLTKDYPCAFHFNGGAKSGGLREPILKHLKLI